MEKGVPTASLVCRAVSHLCIPSHPLLSPASCLPPLSHHLSFASNLRKLSSVCHTWPKEHVSSAFLPQCPSDAMASSTFLPRCPSDARVETFTKYLSPEPLDSMPVMCLYHPKSHRQRNICSALFLPSMAVYLNEMRWFPAGPTTCEPGKTGAVVFSQGFLALGFLPGVLPQSPGFWSPSPCVPVAVCPIPAWVEAISGAGAQRTSSVSPF